MIVKLYTFVISIILSFYNTVSWMLIGRWSKLNRLASHLESLKDEENKLCYLLISLNEVYLEQSNQIRSRRQNIALERLKILEQIGQISVPETKAKSCEILEPPKVIKKRKLADKKGDKKVDKVADEVETHLVKGTSSYLDLLVEDTVQQFRDTQIDDESMIRELYNDPAWKTLISDIGNQYQLFSYLGTKS